VKGTLGTQMTPLPKINPYKQLCFIGRFCKCGGSESMDQPLSPNQFCLFTSRVLKDGNQPVHIIAVTPDITATHLHFYHFILWCKVLLNIY